MPLPNYIQPRKYQFDIFQMIRESLREHRSVCVEAPTGSGKSVLASMIVSSFEDVNKLWKLDRHIVFLVNEIFLLEQFSKHLTKWHIPHDIIGAGYYGGRPVNVHVATIQTLSKHPQNYDIALFIIDECQYSTSNQYIELLNANQNAKVVGITASPEGPGGKGLSLKSGCGIFEILIKSPVDMLELTELGYLCPISYWSVPTKDYDDVSMSCGDFKASEIEKLMKEKGVYGDAVTQMERFPDIKNHILVFAKSVKSCYEMQTIFMSAGYTADVIEGKVTKTNRKKIMKSFEQGEIQILISCKMVLKGVDIPMLRMCIDVAPTQSRMIWKQKVGRLTRPYPGKESGIYLDLVGNILRATRTGYVYELINWRFDSLTYTKRTKVIEAPDVYCPVCFGYIGPNETKCPHCGAVLKKKHIIKPKKEKKLEGDLVEFKAVPLRDRPPEERKEIQDAIFSAVRDEDIEKLREIGESICQNHTRVPYFVYHKLSHKKKIVDIPLLYKIQRSFGYKKSWVFFARQTVTRELRKRKSESTLYND